MSFNDLEKLDDLALTEVVHNHLNSVIALFDEELLQIDNSVLYDKSEVIDSLLVMLFLLFLLLPYYLHEFHVTLLVIINSTHHLHILLSSLNHWFVVYVALQRSSHLN